MKKKRPINKEGAFLMAADLCAVSEYCETEIRKRLHRWGVNNIEMNEIIERLYEEKFLDEFRFAVAYTKDKHRLNGWGIRKIKFYLKSYGISPDAIETGIQSIDEDEYKERLYEQLAKKSANVDLNDYEQRAKVYNHLKCKGYETNLITEAIKKLMRGNAGN